MHVSHKKFNNNFSKIIILLKLMYNFKEIPIIFQFFFAGIFERNSFKAYLQEEIVTDLPLQCRLALSNNAFCYK